MSVKSAVEAKPKARNKGNLFTNEEKTMREIKFRHFDKRLNDFLFFELLSVGIGQINDINSFDKDRADTPLGQYTGLKDKNGNEIYEGDIVKTSPDGYTSINAKVIYECGSFWLYSTELHLVFDGDSDNMVRLSTLCLELEGFELDQLHQLTVIGNIYQNPELLEGDK